MRFRIALPLANVILGILLLHLGDLQVRRLVATHGTYEGIQDGAAAARYLDYAFNAPAWALLGDTRDQLWGPSTYWTGYDLHYLFAIAVMWFLIGFALDRRAGRKGAEHRTGKTLFDRVIGWGCLFYGLFICYSIFPQRHRLSPNAYFLVLLDTVAGGHGWWWYPLGLAWGLGLTAVGLYFVMRLKKREEPASTALPHHIRP